MAHLMTSLSRFFFFSFLGCSKSDFSGPQLLHEFLQHFFEKNIFLSRLGREESFTLLRDLFLFISSLMFFIFIFPIFTFPSFS